MKGVEISIGGVLFKETEDRGVAGPKKPSWPPASKRKATIYRRPRGKKGSAFKTKEELTLHPSGGAKRMRGKSGCHVFKKKGPRL